MITSSDNASTIITIIIILNFIWIVHACAVVNVIQLHCSRKWMQRNGKWSMQVGQQLNVSMHTKAAFQRIDLILSLYK